MTNDSGTQSWELTLQYETLTMPNDPDQALILYTAEPHSPAAEALGLLTSWMMSEDASTAPDQETARG